MPSPQKLHPVTRSPAQLSKKGARRGERVSGRLYLRQIKSYAAIPSRRQQPGKAEALGIFFGKFDQLRVGASVSFSNRAPTGRLVTRAFRPSARLPALAGFKWATGLACIAPAWRRRIAVIPEYPQIRTLNEHS
jgi:hypothetical protein